LLYLFSFLWNIILVLILINGVKSCILAISWHQNWPFRNYNLIQKIKNFQNIFLKINLFYMHQYTMTSEIYSWNQISGRFKAWHMVSGRVVGHQCRNLRFFFLTGDWRLMVLNYSFWMANFGARKWPECRILHHLSQGFRGPWPSAIGHLASEVAGAPDGPLTNCMGCQN
jgi:hypothetical protein